MKIEGIDLFTSELHKEFANLKSEKFSREKQKFFGLMTAKSRGYIDGVNACIKKLKKCYKAVEKESNGYFD